MFDYPIPKPFYTDYHKLGIYPEVSSKEKREAIEDFKKKLQNKKASILKVQNDQRDSNLLGNDANEKTENQNEKEQIDKEIKYIGTIKTLGDKQLEYDLEHPPFVLLKLENENYPNFAKTETQPKETLFSIHKEINNFLQKQGIFCNYLTVLKRTNFTKDFVTNSLLDI